MFLELLCKKYYYYYHFYKIFNLMLLKNLNYRALKKLNLSKIESCHLKILN